MSMEEHEKRLDRIEEKIDKLSEALVIIARTDEKLLAMEAKYSAQYDRLNKFSEKLDEIDKKVDANATVVSNIGKVFWVIITTAIGIVMTWVIKG